MMDTKLQPRKITDILDNADGYIAEMRRSQDKTTIPRELKQYIWMYFRTVDVSKALLETLAAFWADNTYRIASALTVLDDYTYAFFAGVMAKLWDSLQDRGVDTFYILDNQLREDRFKITCNLFKLSGFRLVMPYFDDTLDVETLASMTNKKVTHVVSAEGAYNFVNLESVEAQLKHHMETFQNIIYIEKDQSINYLERIIEIGRQSSYLCIFRNEAPEKRNVQLIRSNAAKAGKPE